MIPKKSQNHKTKKSQSVEPAGSSNTLPNLKTPLDHANTTVSLSSDPKFSAFQPSDEDGSGNTRPNSQTDNNSATKTLFALPGSLAYQPDRENYESGSGWFPGIDYLRFRDDNGISWAPKDEVKYSEPKYAPHHPEADEFGFVRYKSIIENKTINLAGLLKYLGEHYQDEIREFSDTGFVAYKSNQKYELKITKESGAVIFLRVHWDKKLEASGLEKPSLKELCNASSLSEWKFDVWVELPGRWWSELPGGVPEQADKFLWFVTNFTNAKFTRLDLAINMFDHRICYENISFAHSIGNVAYFQKFDEVKSHSAPGRPLSGITYYLGSRESSSFIRYYHAGVKHQLNATRWETEFKGNKCRAVVDVLNGFILNLKHQKESLLTPFSKIICEIALGAVDFIDRKTCYSNGSIVSGQRLDWWQEAFNYFDSQPFKVKASSKKFAIERTITFLCRIKKSIASVKLALGVSNFNEFFKNLLKDGIESLDDYYHAAINYYKNCSDRERMEAILYEQFNN